MRQITTRALSLTIGLSLIPALVASAAGQYRPPSDPPGGENYHVEVGLLGWSPTPVLVINSESLGILGTDVDLVNDLGITSQRFWETRAVLRPAKKHKFRIHYLPMQYVGDTVVQREFVFNALRYRVGLPVATTADLTTWRIGYEYDFIHRDTGYLGFLVDLKYTNVNVALDSPLGSEFTNQVAPVPSFGGAGRVYLAPSFSITGEMTFFKVPENLSENYDGRYLDYDFYGTMNFNRNVGAQIGYRSIDVFYQVDLDRGDLQFKGWYFAGVLRF
jgi:hypothetical protein